MLRSRSGHFASCVIAFLVTGVFVFFYTLLSFKIPEDKDKQQSTSNEVATVRPVAEAKQSKDTGHQNEAFERLETVAVKFLTDVKITDVLLAVFTYLLFRKTEGLDDSTRKLWKAGERQIDVAETSARAATRAADIARDALIASNRAWIRIECDPTATLAFANDTLIGNFHISIINVGNAPATNVTITPETFVISIEDENVTGWQIRKCEEIRAAVWRSGLTVFPGKTYPPRNHNFGTNTRLEDIQKGLLFGEKWNQTGFVLWVSFCVNYRFPSDPRSHQTRTLFNLTGRRASWLSLDDIEASFPIGLMVRTDSQAGMRDYSD